MMTKDYQWTVYLFKKYLTRGILISLFSLFLIVFAYVYINPFLAVLAFLMIFIPNMNFFLPLRYTLSDEGIIIETPLNVKKISWDDVKGYKIIRGGLVLNPPSGRSLVRRSKTIIIYDVPDVEGVRILAEEMIK
jgi:hypothetical protein